MCHGLTIKLADFGLAIKIRDQPDQMDNTLCGTPSCRHTCFVFSSVHITVLSFYSFHNELKLIVVDIAPEILAPSNSRRYNYPVDIWAAGVVLYICLCGFPPFSDELFSKDFPYTLSQQIKEAKFDFPSPYWDPIGDPALEFIDALIIVDAETRLVAGQCLNHPWMMVGATEAFRDAAVGDE